MSEHRVSMLGASWRRFEDPAHSRDPRVREVVDALAALPSPAPRPEFRAELRAQLVAIAPRIVAESAEATTAPAPAGKTTVKAGRTLAEHPRRAGARPQHTDSAVARVPRVRLGRPFAVALTVLTAFALLFGGAVWMSQKALPGDALYGLKRASESWQLSLDGGNDTEKARDYLRFAQRRVDEARALTSRASASAAGAGLHAGGMDSHTASLIGSTLTSADRDVQSASSLLAHQAVTSDSTRPFDVLTAWAPDQLHRLDDLAAAVPDRKVRQRVQSSATVVKTALVRIGQIAPTIKSGCLKHAGSDSYGPTGDCLYPATTPGTSQHRGGKAAHPGKRQGGTGGGGGGNPPARSTGRSTSGAQPGNPTSSAPSSPIVSVPTVLPTSISSLPVTVDSCGLGVTVGPIGIGIGICSGG